MSDSNVIDINVGRRKPEPELKDYTSLGGLVLFLRDFKRKTNINLVLSKALNDCGRVPLLVCSKTGRASTKLDNVIVLPRRRL